MVERICGLGVKCTALIMGACVIKCLLPEGSMKRSAAKAVDMAVLAGLVDMVMEVMPRG